MPTPLPLSLTAAASVARKTGSDDRRFANESDDHNQSCFASIHASKARSTLCVHVSPCVGVSASLCHAGQAARRAGRRAGGPSRPPTQVAAVSVRALLGAAQSKSRPRGRGRRRHRLARYIRAIEALLAGGAGEGERDRQTDRQRDRQTDRLTEVHPSVLEPFGGCIRVNRAIHEPRTASRRRAPADPYNYSLHIWHSATAPLPRSEPRRRPRQGGREMEI